jgi:hypothetical protein
VHGDVTALLNPSLLSKCIEHHRPRPGIFDKRIQHHAQQLNQQQNRGGMSFCADHKTQRAHG